MFLSLALTIVQPESLTLEWNCNFRIRVILKYFHLLSVWGPRYYGSFWDCRWKRSGSKGHLGTLSLQGTKHPEISDVFFTGDEAPWNQLFFSGHSTCMKLILMCVCMIFQLQNQCFLTSSTVLLVSILFSCHCTEKYLEWKWYCQGWYCQGVSKLLR